MYISSNAPQEEHDASTYIASQVRTFTIAGVDTTLRWVPVVAVIVTRALTVELAIAVRDVTLEGLQERLDWEMEVHKRQ